MKTLHSRPRPQMPLNQLPFGQLLVRSGLIDQDDLTVALDLQRGTGNPLGTVLVELGLATEREIIQVLSRQLQIPQLDLESANISPDVTRFVDVQLAERYGVFPVSADPGRSLLRVATSDPNNLEALETLSAHSGMMVLFMLSTKGTIEKTIRRFYRRETTGTHAPLTTTTELRLAEVEQALREQSMAVRSMLELLDKKGVVSREEVLSRLMPAVHRPPPLPLHRAGHQRWLPLLREDS